MKFAVAFYQKEGSNAIVNGGRLIVQNDEYILKCFWWTVARFPIATTQIQHLPLTQRCERFRLQNEKTCYILHFFKDSAHHFMQHLYHSHPTKLE